jgi:uncharacterized protein
MSTNPSDEQYGTGGTPPPPPPGTPPPGDPGAPPPGAYPPPPGGYAPPQGGYAPPPGGYAPPPGGPQAPYAGGGYATQPPLSDSDQRMWATLGHILPIIGLSFVVPLVIWLVFKGRGPFLEDHAKEALNFQITLVIAAIGISIITAVTLGLGAILYVAFIVAVVFMILAAMAANRGEIYRYPVNIRIIK